MAVSDAGGPLPEIKLLRADGQPGADTQFGGTPTFLQCDNTPECCGRRMPLLA